MKAKANLEKVRMRTIVIAISVVVLIGLITSLAVYQKCIAPFHAPGGRRGWDRDFHGIFSEADSDWPGLEPMVMLQALMQEQIINEVAPHPPYNIAIQDQEIEQFLRDQARGKSEEIAEKEYQELFRQQLDEIRLSGPSSENWCG